MPGNRGATLLTPLTHRLLRTGKALNELEALGLVVGQAGLEEHRVYPELCVQEGHIAVHLDKEVDTLVPLVKVRVIMGQGLRAPRASESPPRCHLETGESRVRTQHECRQNLIVAKPMLCPQRS